MISTKYNVPGNFSSGCHYPKDIPKKDKNFILYTMCQNNRVVSIRMTSKMDFLCLHPSFKCELFYVCIPWGPLKEGGIKTELLQSVKMSKILKNSSSKGSNKKSSSVSSLSSRPKHTTIPNTLVTKVEPPLTKSALLALNSAKGQGSSTNPVTTTNQTSSKLSSWPKVGNSKSKPNAQKIVTSGSYRTNGSPAQFINSNVLFNNKNDETFYNQHHQWYDPTYEVIDVSESSSDIATAAFMWKCESTNGHGRTKRVCIKCYFMFTEFFLNQLKASCVI